VGFFIPILILPARAYAVWGLGRPVLIILAISYAASISGAAFLVWLYVKEMSEAPFRVGSGCIVQVKQVDIWTCLAILVFCETLALGLLVMKSIQHAKFTRDLDNGLSRQRDILQVMARDGIGYFACNLAITIGNLICFERLPGDIKGILIPAQIALQNALCYRLLFHIRGTTESQMNTTGFGTYDGFIAQVDTVQMRFALRSSVMNGTGSEQSDEGQTEAH